MPLLKHRAAPAFDQAETPPARTDTRAAVTPLFRQQVIEFQQVSRDWGRVVPLQPFVTRMSVWLIVASVSACIGTLFVVHYARKAAATGYLRPAAGSARIFPTQAGVIDKLYITEGQHVEAGQPLFSVSTGQFTVSGQDVNVAVLNSLREHAKSLNGQVVVEESRTDSERSRLKTQIASIQAELGQLSVQMNTQAQRVRLYEQIVTSSSGLASQGLMSQVEQKRREDTVLEQRKELDALLAQTVVRQQQLTDTRYNLEQLPFVQQEKLRSLRDDLAATEQRAAEVSGRSAYVIRAPISGNVELLEASVGQTADPRRLEAEIVPEGHHLLAEVFVPAQAIGFVQTGQDVRIRYDTFPYLKFGTFHGKVAQVSHTALTPADNISAPVPIKDTSYRVTVALDRTDVTQDGKKIPLTPDMLLRADIILEKHTLAEWFMNSVRMPG